MKNYLLLIFTILFCNISFSQKHTIKYSKARIYYSTSENYNTLIKMGVPLDHGIHKKGIYFESDFSEEEIAVAKNLGLKVDIIIDDVKKYYVDRNLNKSNSETRNNLCINNNNQNNYQKPQYYHHGSMGGFLTYNEAMQQIDSMALLFPNLITARATIDTFKTFEGRSLHWVKISDNPNTNENEPEVLYDAVHHAREPIGIQQLVYFMWYLLENYSTNNDIKAIVDNTELYFVPFVNPDGYIYNETTDPLGGGMWRKNRRDHLNGDFGVDNNRNYDYTDQTIGPIWGTTGISFNTNDQTYCGTNAFSEPENQAMKWFVEQHNFSLALNNHSYSDLLLYPYGYDYNKFTVDNNHYVTISDYMVSQNTMSNILSSLLYPASGDSDDWMYGETTNHSKVFAFTPEIGSASQGFWPTTSDIDPLCESMMHLNLASAHLVSHFALVKDLQSNTISSKSGFLKYNIQSIGLMSPSNFTVTVIPITTNIISIGGAKSHNNMASLQTDLDSISYTLSPTVTFGDQIKYVISLTTPNYVINDTITKTFGTEQVVYTNNANNVTGWQISQSWNTTNATFYSSPSSITDSPFGKYQDNINKTITLNSPVSLANAIDARLTFWAKWEIEPDFDYVQCAVSTDNGNSWIPQCGKYTKTGTAAQDFNQPVYDGFMTNWVEEDISLTDYLNQNILIRFQIVSDNNGREDGFYFDDLEVLVNYGPNGINELSNFEAYLGQSFPNPSNGATTINYSLPQGINNANLIIYNSVGQIIKVMPITETNTSVTISLAEFNSGIYYYSITGKGVTSEKRRMVLIK